MHKGYIQRVACITQLLVKVILFFRGGKAGKLLISQFYLGEKGWEASRGQGMGGQGRQKEGGKGRLRKAKGWEASRQREAT